MEYKKLQVAITEKVAIVALHIPETRNAMDLEIRVELIDLLGRLRDDDGVKVVVIKGSGDNFCAGGDIRSMKGIGSSVDGRTRMKKGQMLIKRMREMEKPIITQVDGVAAGAGVSMLLASDLILATDRARFAFSFVKIGLAPDWGQYYYLTARVGLTKAKELMLTGGSVGAEEALRIGLVNKVVPAEKLEEETRTLASSLARGPSQAYAIIKSALNCWPMGLGQFLELEANMQPIAFGSSDFQEGMQAFLEKREPVFQGK